MNINLENLNNQIDQFKKNDDNIQNKLPLAETIGLDEHTRM